MEVSKKERALIVISSLSSDPAPRVKLSVRLKLMYEFQEQFGAKLAASILGPHYGHVKIRDKKEATIDHFLEDLEGYGKEPSVKVIDMIITLHASQTRLEFADSGWDIKSMLNDINELNVAAKLRLLYSSACYGALHAKRFVQAGFHTACGSKALNATGHTEYAPVLTMWAAGMKFGDAISLADTPLTRVPSDKIASLAPSGSGSDEVNSEKMIFGDRRVTINTGI